MGDIADMRDVDRFMRCEAGQKKLAEIRAALVGKTVTEVAFTNDINTVLTGMTLDSGEHVEFWLPELALETLKETFQADIREEYYRDYPERRPQPEKGTENDGETES